MTRRCQVLQSCQVLCFPPSHFSLTTMSATPCTCESCLQSSDATSFLGPGCVGTKCSVSVTVASPPTSLQGAGRWLAHVKMRFKKKNAKGMEKSVLHSPHNHLMAFLQTQALHPEHHSLQHARQRVGEGDLGCHLLPHDGFSHGLLEGGSR